MTTTTTSLGGERFIPEQDKPDLRARWDVSIEIKYDRIKVKRSVVHRRSRPDLSRAPATRGPVTVFTEASRRRLIERINEISGLTHMITLTYPGALAPNDSGTVRKHWKKLSRWMASSAGTYGVVVKEWQANGAPHLHALVASPPEYEEIRRKWRAIIGAGDDRDALQFGVTSKPMWNLAGAVRYVAKQEEKDPPPAFSHQGRFWSEFGPIQRHPTDRVIAPREQVAPLLRVLQRLEAKARGQARRDDGRFGFTAWNTQVRRVFSTHLHRLCALFGLPEPSTKNNSEKTVTEPG